ncbi:copper uptake system-associated protein [Methylophilus aquaticus]|uniref:Copper uptake system-associated protein n=1 Tax=Methylophilus aquaticus TaxID=1971610 RepID=A0ABT9JS33_9PROT|nr:copper uptake system-associated protein [Methylophilus aquaticus]MDP8567367.1 copper uptake system-associated protein [Methylophilus aquaticus]
MNNWIKLTVCSLVLWWSATLLHAHASAAEDVHSVATEMHETWDKPNIPLILPVIVIHQGMAIADWIQGDKGGRALLKYHSAHQHWHTLLCGGAELTSSRHLEAAGMSAADAQALAALLQSQEQGLAEDQRQRIDSFKGLVKFSKGKPVSSTVHDQHGEMHGH